MNLHDYQTVLNIACAIFAGAVLTGAGLWFGAFVMAKWTGWNPVSISANAVVNSIIERERAS